MSNRLLSALPTPISQLVQRLYNISLLRNSLFIMATSVATAGLGYVYWIIAARNYTDYSVGLASAFISAMSLTAVLSNLGMGPLLIHLLPRAPDTREWSRIFNITLA